MKKKEHQYKVNNNNNEKMNKCKLFYKSCGEYIVTLIKLPKTKTNENRLNVINEKTACYRANKMFVYRIEHKTNKGITGTKKVTNTVYPNEKITYEIGKIVEIKNYDENIYKICGRGIHYFKTRECALYFEQDYLEKLKYTGPYTLYDESGQKKEDGTYLNGHLDGIYTIYDIQSVDIGDRTELTFFEVCRLTYVQCCYPAIKNIINYVK